MWISSKKYDEMWNNARVLQRDKDLLVRLLSGVAISFGGEIMIPIPSTDSRTLGWVTSEDGMMTIKSKVYPLPKGSMTTSNLEDEEVA